jgi:ABC-type phosphate/phosphonate transport system substrate-binding protein
VIAALPMYDFPDLAAAHDALWQLTRRGLVERGIAAPTALTRGRDPWDIWQSPDLLLAQTCGYPFRARLQGKVTLAGTPDYGLEGCAPGYYRSLFVARDSDARTSLAAFDGALLAYNEAMSQSGWAAPQTHATGLGLRLQAGPQTGAHRATVQAVAQGRADLGAIDAVSWRHLLRIEPCARQLRVIAQTAPTPGMPLITAQGALAGQIFDAVKGAIAALSPDMRAALGLWGLVSIPVAAYLAVPDPAPPDPQPH